MLQKISNLENQFGQNSISGNMVKIFSKISLKMPSHVKVAKS